jgi:thymidylate synthase (FAD)
VSIEPEAQQTQITRVSVPALDAILGHKFPVLDSGHIRVIDYMGSDESIVQAARISYGKGTKTVSEDEGLIRYLLRHTHTTPMEMCELKIHIRCPMDLWRQWIRHRTANVNEYSTRYSEAIDDKCKTPATAWRTQSKSNKQGSGDFLPDEVGSFLSNQESDFHRLADGVYKIRLDRGVAKEQARKDLPLSTYTEAYWKCDLHNILHFLSLRMDSHAQLEIRSYANVLGDIVSRWCPVTWKAWNDYNFRRDAMLLSVRDKIVVQILNNEPNLAEIENAILRNCSTWGWFERNKEGKLKSNREREECEAKLATLGFDVPWCNHF